MNLIQNHHLAGKRHMPEHHMLATQTCHKHLVNGAYDKIRQVATLSTSKPRINYGLQALRRFGAIGVTIDKAFRRPSL